MKKTYDGKRMINTIRAATLQDALEALSGEIAQKEAAGERNYKIGRAHV